MRSHVVTGVALAAGGLTTLVAGCGESSPPEDVRACVVGSWRLDHGGELVETEYRSDGTYALMTTRDVASYAEGTWTVADGALRMTPTKEGSGATAAEARSNAVPVEASAARTSVQAVLCEGNLLSLEVLTGPGDVSTFVGNWSLVQDEGYRLRDGVLTLADKKRTDANLAAGGGGGYRETVTSFWQRGAWLPAPYEDAHDFRFCAWGRTDSEFTARVASTLEDCGKNEFGVVMNYLISGQSIGFNAHTRQPPTR